ncbi:MAG TPA: ribonuclease III [Patescibacteria group bacterium]|jgi:ribonuclease-3|nr:ribonuclease III [Patescibacteria group bacterium]
MQDFDFARFQNFAQATFGFTFNNPDLLVMAFTHRSYVNEHKNSVKEHNERLEFLGDAVLELAVTEFLYSNYSEPEGILTNWRAALVRTESISAAAGRLGFEAMLRLSRGERQGGERARAQILANSFEAVTGAIYLDQGYEVAKNFIHQNIISTFAEILNAGSWRDPKSHLQEVIQSGEGQTPTYRVLSEEGPDHDKVFTLGVYVGPKLLGQGTGPSKQVAQQVAAERALKHYTKTASHE